MKKEKWVSAMSINSTHYESVILYSTGFLTNLRTSLHMSIFYDLHSYMPCSCYTNKAVKDKIPNPVACEHCRDDIPCTAVGRRCPMHSSRSIHSSQLFHSHSRGIPVGEDMNGISQQPLITE